MILAALLLWPAVALGGDDPDEAHFQSHGGYATTEVAVIRGRVGRGKPLADKPSRGSARRVIATARTFAGRDVEEPRLRIGWGTRSAEVKGDDEGFFEARLPGPFPPGRHSFQVRLEEPQYSAPPLVLELDVVDGKNGYVVVTDIDDTLIDTGVTGSRTKMIAKIAKQDARDIRAFPGAAEAMSTFAAAGIPVVYLTASPVELAPRIGQFLELRKFPGGALFLRYYPNEGTGDPTAYKRARIERVLADFPGRKLVMFGDNGEKDPEIFGTIAKETGRVKAVFIRRTLPVEPGEPRYAATPTFGAWSEVVPMARAAGILAP